MEEKYEIGNVKGFQVVSTDGKYFSRVFPTLEEAKAHEAELLKTPEKEESSVKKRNIKSGKFSNVKRK